MQTLWNMWLCFEPVGYFSVHRPSLAFHFADCNCLLRAAGEQKKCGNMAVDAFAKT